MKILDYVIPLLAAGCAVWYLYRKYVLTKGCACGSSSSCSERMEQQTDDDRKRNHGGNNNGFRLSGLLSSLLLLLLIGSIYACAPEEKHSLKIGDSAPDFTAVDMDNESILLSDWQGAPVVLRFWDTECKYCRADTPIFNHYFDKYKNKGLKVVYINTEQDSKENVEGFVRDLEIGFPVILNGGAKIASLYRVKNVPQTIIIDPRGIIKVAILGGVGEVELEELVGKYFKESV